MLPQLRELNLVFPLYLQAISDKFGVQPDRLRFYVHYHPSYYHFHVHIVHVALPIASATVGKGKPLLSFFKF